MPIVLGDGKRIKKRYFMSCLFRIVVKLQALCYFIKLWSCNSLFLSFTVGRPSLSHLPKWAGNGLSPLASCLVSFCPIS